jgi:Transposase DDE domain
MTKSIQRELDDFYQKITGTDFQIRGITKGAFTQARSKLSYEVFIDHSKIILKEFYKDAPAYSFNGLRLLATDGSTVKLPKHSTTIDEFGLHKFGPHADSPQCLARISVLYDVLNHLTIDAKIAPFSTGEQTMAYQHLECVEKGDLLLYDRLYGSFKLMHSILERKAHFCIRMKDNWFKEVEQFQKEAVNDKIVTFTYEGKSFKVRLLKIDIGDGNTEILATSLLSKAYNLEDFKELYQSRWGIETSYNLFKNWAELENFSGKTALAVKQDFYAKIYIMNLTSALAHPIEEKIQKEKQNYQLNRVDALAKGRQLPVQLFIKQQFEQTLMYFDKIVEKSVEIVRKNRSFERSKKPKAKFSMIYKNL